MLINLNPYDHQCSIFAYSAS